MTDIDIRRVLRNIAIFLLLFPLGYFTVLALLQMLAKCHFNNDFEGTSLVSQSSHCLIFGMDFGVLGDMSNWIVLIWMFAFIPSIAFLLANGVISAQQKGTQNRNGPRPSDGPMTQA